VQALTDEALDYDDQLRRTGHFIMAQALQPVETAKIVRVQGGKVAVTDGPFAETKEFLAGFILIEAHDMDDAVRVASKIPPGRYGFVEVRPIMELTRSGAADAA
jgi:hypothetical protein